MIRIMTGHVELLCVGGALGIEKGKGKDRKQICGDNSWHAEFGNGLIVHFVND